MIGVKDTAQISSPYTSFPYDLFVRGEFKDIVNNLVARTNVAKTFKPRLYTYADYILVKLYAFLTNKSVHWAAETLNRNVKIHAGYRTKRKMKRFKDNIRTRRLVPHQTDVDKFFRICEENEITIHNIFGNVLTAIAVMIIKRLNPSRETYVIVDNTEIPYFGKASDSSVIGTHRPHMGTKKCHLIQGMGVKGAGMFLFTGFRLMHMGLYRSKFIPQDVGWLRFNGMKVKAVLADREFYRATLLRALKNAHVDFLIPIKKFPKTKAYLERFLEGKGELVSPYIMYHSGERSGHPTCVYMNLVIIGHEEESAFDIRDAYRSGVYTFNEALAKLSGFFTSLQPWENVKKWALWLTKIYKQRWHEETGFADVNWFRIPFKHHTGQRALTDQYLLGIIYTLWQAYRKAQKLKGTFPRDMTKRVYAEFLAHNIEWGMSAEISARLSVLSFKKREVYFGR